MFVPSTSKGKPDFKHSLLIVQSDDNEKPVVPPVVELNRLGIADIGRQVVSLPEGWLLWEPIDADHQLGLFVRRIGGLPGHEVPHILIIPTIRYSAASSWVIATNPDGSVLVLLAVETTFVDIVDNLRRSIPPDIYGSTNKL